MLNVKSIKWNQPDPSVEHYITIFNVFRTTFTFIIGRDEIESYYAKLFYIDIDSNDALLWESYGTDIRDMFKDAEGIYNDELSYFITVSDTVSPLLWKQDSENYKKLCSEMCLFHKNYKFCIEYNENAILHWHMTLSDDDIMLWQNSSATMAIAMRNIELFYKKEMMKLFD